MMNEISAGIDRAIISGRLSGLGVLLLRMSLSQGKLPGAMAYV